MSFFYKSTNMFREKKLENKIIALAGNPNVGKSTVFNALTGLHQHTGNWAGKTVSNARGNFSDGRYNYTLVDIPGTYSLLASSYEEEVARDFICFNNIDATIVVVDATSLERNLNLVLQILEVTNRVVVCVNLLDEAKKKKIHIDFNKLSSILGVPVVGTEARRKKGIKELVCATSDSIKIGNDTSVTKVKYCEEIEYAISEIEKVIRVFCGNKIDSRWLSVKLLDYDEVLNIRIREKLGIDLLQNEKVKKKVDDMYLYLEEQGISKEEIRDKIVTSVVNSAERIYKDCVRLEKEEYNERDRKIDKILTSKVTGIPIMAGLFGLIFWITIVGANYPSELLSNLFFGFEEKLYSFFISLGISDFIVSAMVFGIYRTLSWVVSVMLPPMAIFFPLFTLLEDLGYLPRIAFNMDKFFRKASAHGKQALTMCMGFGCNACGVTGCRIIDSPRERLIAILTNCFVPCNGRFPTLIAIITMFFAFSFGVFNSFISALLLTLFIIFGVLMTLIVSKILSKTLLKGEPSSFSLELPPYRKPQVIKVIIRSILDRTIIILGRAIIISIPAGLLIWVMANVNINGISIFTYCTNFLNPFGKMIGVDGTIILAFMLGLPANEIVIPIILMSYMSTGMLVEYESLEALKIILINNGWTWVTALCTMILTLFHFPCGTTLLTIRKETKSTKWMLVAFLIPTIIGISLCFFVNLLFG